MEYHKITPYNKPHTGDFLVGEVGGKPMMVTASACLRNSRERSRGQGLYKISGGLDFSRVGTVEVLSFIVYYDAKWGTPRPEVCT